MIVENSDKVITSHFEEIVVYASCIVPMLVLKNIYVMMELSFLIALCKRIMAIQFARMRVIGRSKAMNACERAAYNANLKIKDNRINKTFNFLNLKTNVYHEVLLPSNADQRFKNIEVLMNEVEQTELKKNSQLLKEYTLALPHEEQINLRHKIALSKLFVRKLGLIKHNLAVVIDVHSPNQGEINWYSKILVTTRRFTPDGKSLGMKARDLDLSIRNNGGKLFVPKDSLSHDGVTWANVQNDFFKSLGFDLRVDGVLDKAGEHLGIRKYGILAEQQRSKKQVV